jgi:hypothetical protein
MKSNCCFLLLALVLLLPASARSGQLPGLEQAVAAKHDVWGEAAMAEPNGPSYEFFKDILPPPRYVHADFRYYPIVLSVPNATIKARLISDGSGVNLHGGSRSWNDVGTAVTFRVGPDEFLFGSLRDRLQEPTLAEGFLPIVEIRYSHPSPVQSEGLVPLDQKKTYPTPEIYRLEAFVSTDPELASNAVVFVRFWLAQGASGFITAHIDSKTKLTLMEGKIQDETGRTLAFCDPSWKWERNGTHANFKGQRSAIIAIPAKPLGPGQEIKASLEEYLRQRDLCAKTWRGLLDQSMRVETPEPYVNDAWRHLLIQNFELINGDRIHYSAGNQYDKIYSAEGSDAALAMLVWGYEKDTRRLIVPLLNFTRKGLEFHQAGFKLNDVCRYYWQTRDAAIVRELKPLWEKEATRLVENRTGPDGLFPKEQYCGDISTPVLSLNANAKAWRALRDLGAMLGEIGERAQAEHYLKVAADFKTSILAAVARSVRRDITPPFVPIALLDKEPIHDPICEVRIGSYWNIIIGYTISSGIFPPGSEEENWIPHYQEQHGGLCMGMIRSGGAAFNFWTGENRVNPLYGTRYALDTLRRDDPERALVSFYGMLAQGFTPNTFICGEGCTLAPVDSRGRFFYCPPNSAANGHFLSMLRYLLVQDWDLDDDGKPESLRLGFATPKRWMEDGKVLKVERAPTAFGPVSFRLESHLAEGTVKAELDLPQRNPPGQAYLRVRVPDGWKVMQAEAPGGKFNVDEKGTVDVTGLKGKIAINFTVKRPD